MLKEEVRKEIEYFFENRYVMREPWHKRYFPILISVFCVNLLARQIERRLYNYNSRCDDRYSKFAPATMLALKEYNNNRSKFFINARPFVFIEDLIREINTKVNAYCNSNGCRFNTEFFIHANTPMGVELEFSNKGRTAGKLFESTQHDALLNFSKYHHYHLTKFMWRLGAYVDAEMPFKQLIRKGGFLEYTFTRPDIAFKPSEPLTSSPALAARLIEESVKFTPMKPHSLHVTFQIDSNAKKKPTLSFQELLFMMMCTGHFVTGDNGVYESRITEGNMKDWAVIRDRRNDSGWVLTVEFTHMRCCRDFVRRKVFEPSILLLLAYKNLFNFSDIEVYSKKLNDWARKPSVPNLDINTALANVRNGLDMEISLPERYKNEMIKRILELYNHNKALLTGNIVEKV